MTWVQSYWEFYGHVPPEKAVVRLYGLDNVGAIVRGSTGVAYHNQTGGTFCLQPAAEGVLVPADDDNEVLFSALEEYFVGPNWNGACAGNMGILDADVLDDIFRRCHAGSLKMDRRMLAESHEAWLFVIVEPASRDREESVSHDVIPIFGIGPLEAILTWPNSD